MCLDNFPNKINFPKSERTFLNQRNFTAWCTILRREGQTLTPLVRPSVSSMQVNLIIHYELLSIIGKLNHYSVLPIHTPIFRSYFGEIIDDTPDSIKLPWNSAFYVHFRHLMNIQFSNEYMSRKEIIQVNESRFNVVLPSNTCVREGAFCLRINNIESFKPK